MKGLLTNKNLHLVMFSLIVFSCSKEIDGSDVILLNSEKDIIEFTFLSSDNEELEIDVNARIDQNDKLISVVLPYGTPISALKPSIKISESASIIQGTDIFVDFSEPLNYSVIAEDGTSSDYTVRVRVVASTDQEILLTIFNQNPDNTLGWDITNDDVSTWEGVVVIDEKIIGLELDEKGLTILPPEICDLFYLKTLSLEGNMIAEIPRQIEDLSNNLRVLNLGGNQIEIIPEEFFSLEKLTDLRVYTNMLVDIPSDINKLTELRYLSLSNNTLETLPSEIFELSKLNSLFINNIELSEVPEEITNLSQLTSLGVSSNPLGSISDYVLELGTLTRLDIYNAGISTIPSGITKLTNLKRLQLSGNDLAEVNKSVGDLFLLESLLLKTNAIAEIPVELSNLINLNILDVSENNIVSMPNAVCDLINTGTEIVADTGVGCM
ncbi:Leucine rich repeat-containing protein [Aquimarina amphilecti]|uniref:Leucine rich repeat-containing protein n=1 Tax=Aquimarina amphilecti TaxID=1038014 RepID=A0A1H7X9X0_AQUAM|nr:leucine-rich repeat domain-containing protein [Aquimarina amphilecti]SEM29829.1 Leucine rich repeat-containing protein [Aquimarina amphilecti]